MIFLYFLSYRKRNIFFSSSAQKDEKISQQKRMVCNIIKIRSTIFLVGFFFFIFSKVVWKDFHPQGYLRAVRVFPQIKEHLFFLLFCQAVSNQIYRLVIKTRVETLQHPWRQNHSPKYSREVQGGKVGTNSNG